MNVRFKIRLWLIIFPVCTVMSPTHILKLTNDPRINRMSITVTRFTLLHFFIGFTEILCSV
jgi:hypothetical protein